MSLDRALMLTDLAAWLALDDGHRAKLRETCLRLSIKAGRRWGDIPDDELVRIYRAAFGGDGRTDAEFDSEIPF